MDPIEGSGDDEPGLDVSMLVGLPPDEAVAIAKRTGIADVRVLEFVGDHLVGAVDMSLNLNRLNLESENGLVRRAQYG